MNNKDKSQNSLTIAFIIGLSLILITSIIAVHKDLNWLKEYQTLISGLLGSAIASITAFILWSNRNDDLHRKHLAAKANMLDALSDLCEYNVRCFNYIVESEKGAPKKPKDSIQIFKDSIEFLDTQSSEALSELVQFYQVHNSRLSRYQHSSKESSLYKDRIMDVIMLNHFVLRIFSYARNQEGAEKVPTDKLTQEKAISSLKALMGQEYYLDKDKEIYDHCIAIIGERLLE